MEVDNSDVMVPVVSAGTNFMYCASKKNGDYDYVGLDWTTGEDKADVGVSRRQPPMERIRRHHDHP